ncbi:ubiquinone/menaquinone biosynthesis C-methylase UbiE [Streptomyces sp. 3211.6]|uniref:class I SAM-dependent methyltransferase n=1 Tax=Streptomyces sp. 3211.6 TaxID=1938845 RepID=UPI000EB1E9EB|nr:class I SAM-dependent methyltransferase [Streptomyces sp. 3211.6]RKT02359.1 ubiquinone/menaquinone biosynthesis C-methylase UbiE [Streptomyces sp. 3211.6]
MQHIVNTDQAQAWNGYEGNHWAQNQDRWDAVNAGFNEPLLAAAAIQERDRVLDIGCGTGCTTRLAARRARNGQVLGLDLSAPMLARARETAQRENIPNVAFEQGDAQAHAFEPGVFDVSISRFGVMFFADPVAAFTNIRHALRPGGRTAFLCAAGAEDNEWLQAVAALRDILPVGEFGAPGSPGMFALADPDRTREILSAAGFEHIDVVRVDAYGTWGQNAADAAAFLLNSGPGRHLTSQVEQQVQDRARHTLTDILGIHEENGALRLRTPAWLVTANRPK